MLTPQQVDDYAAKAAAQLDPLAENILKDMARRIAHADYMTDTAKWQVERARAEVEDLTRRDAPDTGRPRCCFAPSVSCSCRCASAACSFPAAPEFISCDSLNSSE